MSDPSHRRSLPQENAMSEIPECLLIVTAEVDYELDSPDAITTPKFRAMRGWYQFAPYVRSRTQVIVPVESG